MKISRDDREEKLDPKIIAEIEASMDHLGVKLKESIKKNIIIIT